MDQTRDNFFGHVTESPLFSPAAILNVNSETGQVSGDWFKLTKRERIAYRDKLSRDTRERYMIRFVIINNIHPCVLRTNSWSSTKNCCLHFYHGHSKLPGLQCKCLCLYRIKITAPKISWKYPSDIKLFMFGFMWDKCLKNECNLVTDAACIWLFMPFYFLTDVTKTLQRHIVWKIW